ncbi:WYL domain-containing protein [uncultured Desulfobacter sp.]|uniref:helix-turn-helix transcriptional regulator n=1 Tax=uncultured Desulfobacter sp. TaxID=240139 RepID=UPI002AABA8E1|nr:WYL domain-containing protein [uncultured Desulfobacter sp.]
MVQIERLKQLVDILSVRRYPISLQDLHALVDYSQATLKRYIRRLRDDGAPLRFDKEAGGYILDKTDEAALQLPGFWLNISELHALLAINELITQLGPGLLKPELVPIRSRIETLLSARGVSTTQLARRIKVIGIGIRGCRPMAFSTVATALIERTRLTLCYHSRGEDKKLIRTVSPQRLFYYRGNWYLAAFCHNKNALRAMALERMSDITRTETACLEVDDRQLNDHFFSSFGIFGGRPTARAILRFSPKAARWVAEEQWHPDQAGQWLSDGSYELHLPYADQRELVMEILRYGPDVRVVAPKSLEQEVCRRLQKALNQYEKKTASKK